MPPFLQPGPVKATLQRTGTFSPSCGFAYGYQRSAAVRAGRNRHCARTNTAQPEEPRWPRHGAESVVLGRRGLGTFEGEKLSLMQILEYGAAFRIRAGPDHHLRPALR